jgi:hypothetical protein
MWKLGGLAISRTIAPPVNVVRAKSNLRRDPVDHWVISYCARGAHLAQTAGAELEVPARVPFLWSLGRNFCTNGRMLTESSSFWRATRSGILRRCSMGLSGRPWTRLSDICLVTT